MCETSDHVSEKEGVVLGEIVFGVFPIEGFNKFNSRISEGELRVSIGNLHSDSGGFSGCIF